MSKKLLKALLPPVVVDIGRRVIPGRPMFSGTHASPEGIRDERPWLSDERIAYAESELKQVIGASAARGPLPGSLLVPALVIDLVSAAAGTCSVLDFGGGTGVTYFSLRAHLARRAGVTWMVVDNPRLIELGTRYKSAGDNLHFHESIPQDRDVDVVLINTALQYVTDCWSVLSDLLERRPRFFVLTRLIAGAIPTFFTRQNNIQGGTAPCLFLNVDEVGRYFESRGYALVHSSYAAEDTWDATRYEDVPPANQLAHTMNLVFEKAR